MIIMIIMMMMMIIIYSHIYNKILDRDWFPVSICHVNGARSFGCPITGIQFDLFVIGYH